MQYVWVYQQEQILLTEEMKIKREEAIIKKENEAKELQQNSILIFNIGRKLSLIKKGEYGFKKMKLVAYVYPVM